MFKGPSGEELTKAWRLVENYNQVLRILSRGNLLTFLDRVQRKTGTKPKLIAGPCFTTEPNVKIPRHEDKFLRFENDLTSAIYNCRYHFMYTNWYEMYEEFRKTRKDFQITPLIVADGSVLVGRTEDIGVRANTCIETLNANDRRFLRSLRIAVDDEPQDQQN